MNALPISVVSMVLLAVAPWLAFEIRSFSVALVVAYALSLLVAAPLLFRRFTRIDASSLWFWIVIFLIVVGYVLKTIIAARWLQTHGTLVDLNKEWADFDLRNLRDAYVLTCLSFIAFGIGVLALTRPLALRARTVIASSSVVRTALVFAVLLSVASLVARGMFDIGVMGVESNRLPFGLDTVIFRLQAAWLPAVFLVILWYVDVRGRMPVLYAVAFTLLALHYVAVAAVSASKAGLMYFLVLVIFSWIASRRFTRARVLAVAALSTLAVVLFIVGSETRTLRVEGYGFSEALAEVVNGGLSSASISPLDAITAIVLRISGVDGLWFALQEPDAYGFDLSRVLSIQAHGMVEFYTRNIVGVTWLQDFRAPGFVAAAMLIGGIPGVLLLSAATAPMLSLMTSVIGREPAGDALIAFFGAYVLQTLMEGIFQWQDLLACAIAIASCAIALRLIDRYAHIQGLRRRWSVDTTIHNSAPTMPKS